MSERPQACKRSRGRMGPFGLGMTVGALAALIVARRMSKPPQMPNFAAWRKALAEKRGESEAARLLASAQARYDELYAARARPTRRALRVHMERGILPGLALYQTLLEESGDRQAAVAEVESLPTSTITILSKLMPLLGRLPDPFAAFRRITAWVVGVGFPAEGWQIAPVEASNDCIAFDVRRCFYLDVLARYGAPELTRVHCQGDDALFAMLPRSITWERTMTLGRGGDRCDFRWRRVAPELGPTQGPRSAS
jgi:hypothetical protein